MTIERLIDSLAIGEGGSRRLEVVRVANPAAGADWTQTVPGGRLWVVRGVMETLTTSAAVATRLPKLTYSDGSTVVARAISPQGIAASLAVTTSWLLDAGTLSSALSGADQVAPLPPIPMQAGWVIASSTTAIQGADQWSAVAILVEVITKGTPELIVAEQQRYFESE